MTTMKTVAFAVMAAVATTGCDPFVFGDGKVVDEVRTVPEFTKGLRVESNLKVRYSEGPQSVTVRADSNVLGYIQTFVEDGVLVVKRVEDLQFLAQANELTISGPVLPKFEAGSASTIEVSLPPVDELRLAADASSRVVATGIEAARLEVEADAASTVIVSGQVSTLKIAGSASSTVDTTGAAAARATATATGSAWLKVRVSDEVTGVSDSSSRIEIYGRPRATNIQTASSGTVTFAE